MKKLTLHLIPYGIAMLSAGVFIHTLISATVGAPAIEASTTTAATAAATTAISTMPAAPLPPAATSNNSVVVYPASPQIPQRLSIPVLHINAAVQSVGLNAKEAIGVPSNFTDVAWYKYSAVPGAEGNAIIDGHVDNGLGLAGVFKHLSDIKVGDDVYITTNQGKQLTFVVSAIHVYGYQDVPMDTLLQSTGSSQIELVTCEGNWVPNEKTYDERIVVTATLQ